MPQPFTVLFYAKIYSVYVRKIFIVEKVLKIVFRLAMKVIPAQRLFLYFALPFGLLFVFLTPPFGGGDEQHHFLRAYEIASGQWLGHSIGPSGIKQFQDGAMAIIFPAIKNQHYSNQDYAALNAITLDANTPTPQLANPMMMAQFPLAHSLYVPTMAIGILFDMKPLHILYLCRASGMLLSVLLIYIAIRKTPVGGYVMAAIALLPTAVFFRSFIHTDGLMLGLAFLFFASISRMLCAQHSSSDIQNNRIAFYTALLIAPLKTGYAMLPLLALITQKHLSAYLQKRGVLFAVIALPGLMLAAIWLYVVSTHIIQNITYETSAGSNINPSLQLQYILHHPLTYVRQLAKYVFNAINIGEWIVGMFSELGWMKIYLPLPTYLILLVGLCAVIRFDSARLPTMLSFRSRMFIGLILVGTISLILTLINIAFNPVGAGTFTSFQGRYFLPLLPFMLWLLPAQSQPVKINYAPLIVTLMSIIGLGGAAFTLFFAYFAHGL